MDTDGDEFFDAGAEPSSPSFAQRAAGRGGPLPPRSASLASNDSFASAGGASSRADSFKDAPGPSELWPAQGAPGLLFLMLGGWRPTWSAHALLR